VGDQGLSDQADADLVDRVRAGDDAAFADLYRAHYPAVRQVAASHLRDPDAVADVVQDAFTQALQALPRLRDPHRFRPWLMSIARHAAVDQIRFRSRMTSLDADSSEEMVATGPGPDALAELRELADRVEQCVMGLSPRDATAVAMVTHLGFGPDQVGAALGLTSGAAKVVVHRARRRLRQALVLHLMVKQPSLACAEFRVLLQSDVLAAGRHLESCHVCIDAAGAEVIPFHAPAMPATPA
jgi:RNA polymerase sigma factor (sigma-70 family)